MGTSVGSLVIRAWVEPGAAPHNIRARVLAIRGPESEVQELGVAAGTAAILELVEEGLKTVLPVAHGEGPVS
jgi:hypothetical protein